MVNVHGLNVVVPVILEVVVEWNLWDSSVVLSSEPMGAPGVLRGRYDASNGRSSAVLRTIRMELDTKALLKSMMEHAKLLVRKVLIAATCLVQQSQPSLNLATVIPPSSVATRANSSKALHKQLNANERRERQKDGRQYNAMMPPPPKRAPSGEGRRFTSTHSKPEAGAQPLQNATFSVVSCEKSAPAG